MSVQAILREKGAHVITAGGETTLREASELLHRNHIGAVVVVNGVSSIEGIFTERDLVAAIAVRGASSLEESLSSAMWRNVYRCTPTTSINSLMDTMNRHKARHLPVEHNGRLAGIVSIGDAVRHHIRAIQYEAEHIRSYFVG
jgi:CBS domain-containing protein